MDLCVSVVGSGTMEHSLLSTYACTETLDGANSYMCSACDKLVSAKKVRSVDIAMHCVSHHNYVPNFDKAESNIKVHDCKIGVFRAQRFATCRRYSPSRCYASASTSKKWKDLRFAVN